MYAFITVIGVSVLWIALSCGLAQTPLPKANGSPVHPELPRQFVETTLTPSTGRTIPVREGDDLQDAIDLAQPGDTVVLQAGATFKGPFELPNKKGTGWITIRTSTPDSQFPPPGTRVGTAHASLMPKLISSRDGGVVLTGNGAHHFRFIGIEITPQQDTYLISLMWFGYNRERSLDELPHHIIVDRCYLHGDSKRGSRRGVTMNGRHLAVIDSHLSDFKDDAHDSQALGGYGGDGPFKIVNNYLEGAAENILFGGADPKIPGLVPSDIEIRRNHLVKPLSWKPGEPGHDGANWWVKFLFELKNARRVLVDGNIFEYHWQMGGYGFAIGFTVRNEEGHSPWAVIEDVTFTNNIVRHSPSGVSILGFDDRDDRHFSSGRAQRIRISNNIFDDINGPRWGGKGRLFQLIRGTKDVVIEHNIGFQTSHILAAGGDPPQEGFVYRYNITPHNENGIEGEGTGVGRPTFERHLPDAVVTHNIMIGGDFYAERYPPTNEFPQSLQAVPFFNASAGDYRLVTTSTLKSAANQEVPGVDAKALCAALGDIGQGEAICAKLPSERRTTTSVAGGKDH